MIMKPIKAPTTPPTVVALLLRLYAVFEGKSATDVDVDVGRELLDEGAAGKRERNSTGYNDDEEKYTGLDGVGDPIVGMRVGILVG